MIDDEEYSSFKFEADDDEPDSEQTIYREEAKDRRVEKLGHRVTIISILIPVLIGAVFYIAYRDIASRVSRTQDTGSMEIQNLSSKLEEDFSQLSVKYSELEAALTQKLEDLEKVDKAMKANLKQAEDTVNKINATKADKKDQQTTLAKIEAALIPLRQELTDLKSVVSDQQASDNDIKQQLAAVTANMDKSSTELTKELAKIQTEITSLSNQKMDKDALQLELLKSRKLFQRDLDVTKSSIDKRLESMLRKIKDLEKFARAPLATPGPSGGSPSQGSGGVVEQEIKE
jgi:chromosome segregation ATPase